MIKKCTIFCDIDGTLFKYRKFASYKSSKAVSVSNVLDRINNAYDEGHHICLTTARPEYLRYHTMKELNDNNINYHQLVMGMERGTRILINDNENKEINRAFAINLERDKGLSSNDESLLDKIFNT